MSSILVQDTAASDQIFWETTTQPLLNKLLHSYTPHLQKEYLSFYKTTVVPHFGPCPSSPKRLWIPNVTHNHIVPVEFSWNMQDEGVSQIRFDFEPIGPFAGTPADPLNQSAAISLVSQLKKSTCPSLDLELWNHFSNELFVSPGELAPLSAKMSEPMVSCLLAFDLPRDKFAPLLKAYFFPHPRALLAGTTTSAALFTTIRKLNKPALLPALEKIETFLSTKITLPEPRPSALTLNLHHTQNNEPAPNWCDLDMIGIDCLPSSQARIKIYGETNDVRFSNLQEIFSMGNTHQNSAKCAKAFEEFWIAVFGLKNIDEEVKRIADTSAMIGFTFEIAEGKDWPDVKLYVPVWHYTPNDAVLCKRMEGYFRGRGWAVADKYTDEIETLFDKKGLETVSGRHSFISFTYKENKGAYITMYYAPDTDNSMLSS